MMARRNDTDVFLQTLIDCGGRASNASLQSKVGWADDKYWKIHTNLFESGKIEKGRGYSGTVILVPSAPDEVIEHVSLEPVSQSPVEQLNNPLIEDALYEPARLQIFDNWPVRHKFDSVAVENIAKQGRRDTGGSWSRPDLALVALKKFEYLPDRIFEIHTFEIKASYDVSVKGVMEALVHRQASTRSYVIYETNGLDFSDYPEARRIENLAIEHGVGVFVAKNINDFNEWAEVVPAQRTLPDPDEMETFIKRSLSDETRAKILKWR
jgi:hypothetical protein